MIKTPMKQKSVEEKTCLVCGNFAKEVRRIESGKIRENNLKDLLKKYGGINVESGIMCRNCYRVLDNIDNKCTQFYKDCQKNAVKTFSKFKRMASSPFSRTPKRKNLSSTPKKTIKAQLFSDPGNVEEILDMSDDLMAISQLEISVDEKTDDFVDVESNEIQEDINVQTCMKVPLNDNESLETYQNQEINVPPTRIPVPLSDHGYVRQKKISVSRKLTAHPKLSVKPTTPQPVDHDYVKSQAPPIRYNPVLKDISELAKEIQKVSTEGLKLGKKEAEMLTEAIKEKDINGVVNEIVKIDALWKGIMLYQMNDIQEKSLKLRNRKHFFVSELMKKSPENLRNFNWLNIVKEMMEKFPNIFNLLLSMMLTPDDMHCYTKIERVVPRIGLMYGIMMQAKTRALSRVQRLVSTLLFDNICDQKMEQGQRQVVFDRLQVVGVCLSYFRSLKLVDEIGGHFNDQVVELIRNDKRFRIVGDNINWMVGIHDQRLDNRSKMMHAFGSAVITQAMDFSHLSSFAPQRIYSEMSVQEFLPSVEDMEEMKRDYIILMSRVAFVHIPFMQQFADVVPDKISTPCSPALREKSKVIPLPVLFKNEQYYQDVVEILAFYEHCLLESHILADKQLAGKKFHIGGDQLTRERFSGAKTLRAHHQTPSDKFEHLSPITFEMFHMHMNYLKMVFKTLYKCESGQDLGTLKSLQDRISRSDVDQNVNAHYDADKDFFISVIDMYLVECFLEFFGMEDTNASPTQHIPPDFDSTLEKKRWYFTTVGKMVDENVFSVTTDSFNQETLEVDGTTFTIQLMNGKQLTLLKPSKSSKKEDNVKNYAHRILEFGLLFKDLLDLTQMPERNRGIRLLKLSMVHFKSHNNLSKYAFEILRLLVHQLCILSEREANEEFYGLFVNTTGNYDGHIPADKRMEFLVKQVKEHIKHMYANKTESNISNRTRAIAGIREVAENFDVQSSVIVRSKKHSDKSSTGDEVVMLEDLRRVRPFRIHPGRQHTSFPNVSSSITRNLNVTHFHEWIETRKVQFALERGN